MLDFGIAAAIGDPEIDFEGRLLGTPAYLAPERLAAGEVLPACDVYALGLLLHRVLTGRLPWPIDAQTGMLRAHVHVEPDPLPEIDGVPRRDPPALPMVPGPGPGRPASGRRSGQHPARRLHWTICGG